MGTLNYIAAEIERNNAVFFIGAGLSMGANLPNWIKLIEPLAKEVGKSLPPPEHLTGIHLLDIAEAYEREKGRNSLLRYLQDTLDPPNAQPTSTHDWLSKLLPRGTLVTTNYDSLIERAYRKAQRNCQTIVVDSDLAYWDESKAQLIKLRGDLGQPDSLVVTRRDYDTYSLKRPLIRNHLQNLLIAKTNIFLGYSFSDPD